MNIDKTKVLNAKIRLTINELQHIIIALVMAEKASESLSSIEFSKSFEIIRKELVKNLKRQIYLLVFLDMNY